MNILSNDLKKRIYKKINPKNRSVLSLVSKTSKKLINNVRQELSEDILRKWKLRSKDMKKLMNYLIEKRLNGNVYFTSNETRKIKNMHINDDIKTFNDFKIPNNLKYKNDEGKNITGNYPQFIVIEKGNKDYVFTKSVLTIHNNNNYEIIPYQNEAVTFKDLLKKIINFYYKFKIKLF